MFGKGVIVPMPEGQHGARHGDASGIDYSYRAPTLVPFPGGSNDALGNDTTSSGGDDAVNVAAEHRECPEQYRQSWCLHNSSCFVVQIEDLMIFSCQ